MSKVQKTLTQSILTHSKIETSHVVIFDHQKMSWVRFGETIDYFYDVISPWIFVGILVTYFLPDNPRFVPYVLVAGCLTLGTILVARLIRVCWIRGWIRLALRWLEYYLSKAWIRALLGLRYVRDTWTGRALGILAVINNVLFLPWIYHNVDVLHWIRSTMQLLHDCVEYVRDPPTLLVAFDTWKDTVPVFGYVLRYGKNYVNEILKACRQGSIWVLFIIPLGSLVLAAGAVMAYAICNWRAVMAYATWNWRALWNMAYAWRAI